MVELIQKLEKSAKAIGCIKSQVPEIRQTLSEDVAIQSEVVGFLKTLAAFADKEKSELLQSYRKWIKENGQWP